MAIRPPRAPRPVRNTVQLRESAIVGVVALVLVVFMLRALLAILSVHTWTIAWKVVAVPSSIIVTPLHQWAPMQRSFAGNLTVAEFLALTVACAAAIVVLATLANRRR